MKEQQEPMITFEIIRTSTPKRTIRYKSEVHCRWGLTKECSSCWLLAVTSLDAPETCVRTRKTWQVREAAFGGFTT